MVEVEGLESTQLGTRSLNKVGAELKVKGIDRVKALRFQHHCVSSIGGFFGAYAILNHNELLASAQTANLINLVMAILGRDVTDFLARLGALVVYLVGFFITIYVPKRTKLNLQGISLAVDVLAVVLLAIMPSNVNDVVALYPVFFAMAIQWNSFVKVEEYTSATIFSTNNLKQATTSLMEYFIDGQKDSKKLDKSRFYGATILGFHLGVALAFFTCKVLGSSAIWMCCVPIIVSLVSHVRVLRSKSSIVD